MLIRRNQNLEGEKEIPQQNVDDDDDDDERFPNEITEAVIPIKGTLRYAEKRMNDLKRRHPGIELLQGYRDHPNALYGWKAAVSFFEARQHMFKYSITGENARHTVVWALQGMTSEDLIHKLNDLNTRRNKEL